MKRFVPLAIFLLAIGWLIGWLFNPYETTNRRLIEAWRQIPPGMMASEVEEIMGSASYEFDAGEGWPEWIARSLPEEIGSDHRLSAYLIEGWGPQILLVVFDAKGKVTFVGSTHT